MNSYDEDRPSKFIVYIVAINLYALGMTHYLAGGEFKWLVQNEIRKYDFNTTREKNIESCELELDPEYLEELQNLHNAYPAASERLKSKKVCYLIIERD